MASVGLGLHLNVTILLCLEALVPSSPIASEVGRDTDNQEYRVQIQTREMLGACPSLGQQSSSVCYPEVLFRGPFAWVVHTRI
jgi:hypothetical protein